MIPHEKVVWRVFALIFVLSAVVSLAAMPFLGARALHLGFMVALLSIQFLMVCLVFLVVRARRENLELWGWTLLISFCIVLPGGMMIFIGIEQYRAFVRAFG